MTPKEVLEKWIDRFNAADAVRLTELYAEDAVNHQVANKPVVGKRRSMKCLQMNLQRLKWFVS